MLEGIGNQHREGGGLAGDAGKQRSEHADEEDVPADRAEEDFQCLAQVAERFHLDAVGPQDFRADDPDRQVDDDTDKYRKQQVVALDAFVLRADPAFFTHDIRVHEVGYRTCHGTDHRYRYQQCAVNAFIGWNAETDGAFDDTRHVGAGHHRQRQEGQGHHRQQYFHDAFDHCVYVAPHQHPHGQHHGHGAQQWVVDPQQHRQRFPRTLDHVGVHQVPHQQGIGQHEPGEHRVQLRIALQNGHPLVIAQLEAGDDVYDQVPEQQRNGQHPHHGVTVVRPGDR
ncbi:hypothetical protein D3C72_885970 [compost metagenome]